MKIYKYSFFFLILLILITIVIGKENNSEEPENKSSFLHKLKYLYIQFFVIIEKLTFCCLNIIKSYNIKEPYDFFFCFIIGCFLRFFYLHFKKIFKRAFNINEYCYVYNEPDNTEKLYEVNKKLNEFSKSMKNMNGDNNLINMNNNEINNINYNINNNEIEKKIKQVNDKLSKLEKTVKDLNQNYEEEKNNIKINLKTIEECQKFIIDSIKAK